jgi:hypothetical protein
MDSNTFEQHLLKVLLSYPAGLSEFELIKKFETEGQPGFEKECLIGNLSLFQTHFFLFHSLYQLREQLSEQLVLDQEQQYQLEISPLCTQLIPLIPLKENNGSSLADHNPLRDYYLDLNNLNEVNEAEVNQLLTQFWERFISNDERRDALEELELQDPVDWPTIKKQHRRLAMQHHPDRGGDEERLQAINAAMELLAKDSRHAGNKKI